jgi:hypothetical protein
MTVLGLPLGTAAALAVVIALPLVAYGLSRVDAARGDGHVTIFGHRGSES